MPALHSDPPDTTGDPFAPNTFEILDQPPEGSDPSAPASAARSRPVSVRPLMPGETAGGRSIRMPAVPIDRVSCLLSAVMIVDLTFCGIFIYSLLRSSMPGAPMAESLDLSVTWLPSALGFITFLALGGWMANRFLNREDR